MNRRRSVEIAFNVKRPVDDRAVMLGRCYKDEWLIAKLKQSGVGRMDVDWSGHCKTS